MRIAHRTPSMIALRARRQAYQIARDVMHPHVEVEPPAVPETSFIPQVDPEEELNPKRLRRRTPPIVKLIAIVIWLLVGFTILIEVLTPRTPL